MDKFFILNAFKTLDEIEDEMKSKNNLKENLDKKELVCEDYDIDELSDKYVGLGCTINSKDDYTDEHGTIQGLKDFEGDFQNSIWTVTLDIGIILNLQGKDLTVDLEEKLPKDLARAYTRTYTRDSSKIDWEDPVNLSYKQIRNYRDIRNKIDYENSTYKEISKEEALKNYSKKGLRNLLRVIIQDQVMRWDKNNELMTKFDAQFGPTIINPYSFKDVIQNADKIYVTDEDKNIITKGNNIKDRDSHQDDIDKARIILPAYGRTEEEKRVASALRRFDYRISDVKRRVFDTGNHEYSPRSLTKSNYGYLYRQYLDYKKKYETTMLTIGQLIKDNKNLSFINEYKHRAEEYLQQSEKYINNFRSRLASYKQDSKKTKDVLNNLMNYNLALLIIYKYLAKNTKDTFLNKRSKGLPNHEYTILQNRLTSLQDKLLEITREIKNTQQQITPELQADYTEKLNSSLEELGDEYLDYINNINDLLRKEPETESLNEDLDIGYIYRVYTVDLDDVEDFIEPTKDNETDTIAYAQSLFTDSDYKRVCAVKILTPEENDEDEIVVVLWDSDDEPIVQLDEEIKDKRSIGEIVDDKLKNESLTEAKKFNVRDKDDMINAKIYQEIGDKTNDNLVVVDPSIESKYEEQEPKIGKAILQCKECKTSIFKDVDNLVMSEDDQTYNLDDVCPHCGAKSGYLYIGQVASKYSKDVQEESNNDELENEPIVDDDDNVSLEPVGTDFTDLNDIEEIQEESFDKLVNPYLTKLYENVENFKTTKVTQTGRNKLMIEGIITGKNKKELNTQFLFTIKENNAGSIVFDGYNKLLTEQKDSFQLKSKYENNILLFESLSYKYNKNSQLVEGLEENK